MQKKQNTVTRDKKEVELIARGRHDPCVVPRGTSLIFKYSSIRPLEVWPLLARNDRSKLEILAHCSLHTPLRCIFYFTFDCRCLI